MVYSLEVTLTVECAESGGSDNTMREKVSHVGQGMVNGALEKALWLGRAPLHLCISQVTPLESKFLFQLSASIVVPLPLSCFAPLGGI